MFQIHLKYISNLIISNLLTWDFLTKPKQYMIVYILISSISTRYNLTFTVNNDIINFNEKKISRYLNYYWFSNKLDLQKINLGYSRKQWILVVFQWVISFNLILSFSLVPLDTGEMFLPTVARLNHHRDYGFVRPCIRTRGNRNPKNFINTNNRKNMINNI